MTDGQSPGISIFHSEFTTPKRKSAGLAWLLSMIVPGAGHFYCGTKLRGAVVLGCSAVGLLALLTSLSAAVSGEAASLSVIGEGFVIVPALYVFGFLDAYFTAREINRGIDPSLVDNPRVACALNLLTRGFGYFYLGERTKGLAVFVAVTFGGFVLALVLAGNATATILLGLALAALSVGIAIDAYRIGRRSFEAQVAAMDRIVNASSSRLPAAIPLAVGGAIVALVLGILMLGAVAAIVRSAPSAS